MNSITTREFQRLSTEKFQEIQNSQISRIFRIKDPNVTVIYITPFHLVSDIINYYSKIFELQGIENYQDRFHVICPEYNGKFSGHIPLSRVLLYSMEARRKI